MFAGRHPTPGGHEAAGWGTHFFWELQPTYLPDPCVRVARVGRRLSQRPGSSLSPSIQNNFQRLCLACVAQQTPPVSRSRRSFYWHSLFRPTTAASQPDHPAFLTLPRLTAEYVSTRPLRIVTRGSALSSAAFELSFCKPSRQIHSSLRPRKGRQTRTSPWLRLLFQSESRLFLTPLTWAIGLVVARCCVVYSLLRPLC